MEANVVSILTMAKVIQTAVAPVFLITGIAAILGVLSNRLARITDRARLIEKRLRIAQDPEVSGPFRAEMRALLKRSRCIHFSFTLSVVSALLVCTVVILLFVSHIQAINLGDTIAISFILAMCLLVLALLSLVAEIYLATRSMRRGMAFLYIDEN